MIDSNLLTSAMLEGVATARSELIVGSLFREVKIRDLWRFIQRHGSSSAHFSIRYRAHEIAFHGLTEEEFRNADNQE